MFVSLHSATRAQALYILLGLAQYQLFWVLFFPFLLDIWLDVFLSPCSQATVPWRAVALLNLIYFLHQDFQSDDWLPWLAGISHKVFQLLSEGGILAITSGCLLLGVRMHECVPQNRGRQECERAWTRVAARVKALFELPVDPMTSPQDWWDWMDQKQDQLRIDPPTMSLGVAGLLLMRLGPRPCFLSL